MSRAMALRPLGAEPSTRSRSTMIATPCREKSKSRSCSGELLNTVSRDRLFVNPPAPVPHVHDVGGLVAKMDREIGVVSEGCTSSLGGMKRAGTA